MFTVADVVWIASGNFTFKFDKSNFLGRIAPVWAEFPEPTRLGWTSFYLQLWKDRESQLVSTFQAIDRNILVFLRKIENIHIRLSSVDQQPWETSIQRTERMQGQDRIVMIHVE